jgi:hypothetical protein
MSNNLQAQRLASGQNNKYITANDMSESLDAALTDLSALDFTAGNIVLTAAQYVVALAFKALNVASGRTLTLQAIRKQSIIWNSGANALTVILGSTSVTVQPAVRVMVYTDGTTDGLYVLATSAVSGSAAVIDTVAYSFMGGF